jgi:nitroreductase
VFAGGDVVSGPAMLSDAIGAGRRAARSIAAHLERRELPVIAKRAISYQGMPLTGCTNAERNEPGMLLVEERLAQPEREVILPLAADRAFAEAGRCLVCGSYKPVFTSVNDYFPEVCIACHNCEAVCPNDALRLPHFYQVEAGRWTSEHRYPEPGKGHPNPFGQESPPRFEDVAPNLTEVERLIYARRSNRIFTDEQVPRELVHRVLEAGRFAPSAGNNMPWKFLVVRDRAFLDEIAHECAEFLSKFTRLYQGKDGMKKSLKNTLAVLMPNALDQRPMVAIQAMLTPKFRAGTSDMFHGAKTVIFVLSNRLGISSPALDAGICCQNMVLTAHALGLGTCYVGFGAEPVNKQSSLRKKLGLEWPFDHVATTIALGYSAVRVNRPVDREFPQVRWIERD